MDFFLSSKNYLYQLGIKNNETSNTCKNKNNKNVTIIDAIPNIKPVFPKLLSPFFIAIIPNTTDKIADMIEIIMKYKNTIETIPNTKEAIPHPLVRLEFFCTSCSIDIPPFTNSIMACLEKYVK